MSFLEQDFLQKEGASNPLFLLPIHPSAALTGQRGASGELS
jgi:hypothetical protein